MIVYSDIQTANYCFQGHPEAPKRITQSHSYLSSIGLTPQLPHYTAQTSDILLAHTPTHWNNVLVGTYDDADTPHEQGIEKYILMSLSGALSAMDTAIRGEPSFSLMRPPGHHAAKERVAGFCFINHMAIACFKALNAGQRVAVLDIDVHHGDGTESLALGHPNWLYVSLHQSPLYPGTGLHSQENCLNYPLAPFTDDKTYLSTLEIALKKIAEFKPNLLGISAGFDTYKKCPLAQFQLNLPDYRQIGRIIADLKINNFSLLEGGYADDLPLLIEQFLLGLSD